MTGKGVPFGGAHCSKIPFGCKRMIFASMFLGFPSTREGHLRVETWPLALPAQMSFLWGDVETKFLNLVTDFLVTT